MQGCCELVRARKLCAMSSPAPRTPAGIDLEALDAVTDAVESGAGLPEVIRASARALDDASLALTDRSGAVLAVAARSPADERGLMGDAAGVETHDLRVADEQVGRLRVRSRSDGDPPSPMVLRLILTLVASEVAAPARARPRLRAGRRRVPARPARAPRRRVRRDRRARRRRSASTSSAGAAIVVVRAQLHVPTEEGWRERVVTVAERGARAAVPTAVAASSGRPDAIGSEVVVLVPGEDASAAERVAEGMLRELGASLPGHSFALGRSRFAADAADLPRAGNEALLAANVAEGDATGEEGPRVMAFDDTGAYRLLLSAMSEDPAELQRFYAETIEPLVAYDEQYETDLVITVEAFLDADGNVAGTAQRLFTHRHTIRYRLERVRELSGLDVGSTDGREKLSLGLKAMRVLGIATRGGPASEQGAGGGRVPRRT